MAVRKLSAASLLSLIFAISIACSSSGEIPEATSSESLAKALESAGLRVDGPKENDFLSASYFSIPGIQYEASGETIFVYEFENPDELNSQRSLVSSDGWGIGSKYIQWITGPSFYQNGKLIVIYDGDASLIMDTLAAAMGEPFAGGDPV